MTVLDFDAAEPSNSTDASKTERICRINTQDSKDNTKSRPRIERVGRLEILNRVASFLPQLASDNQRLAHRPPQEINIEMLKGDEEKVIEMRLGLGVLEEQKSTAENTQKIAVLPSELAQKDLESQKGDKFDTFIQQLLLFNDSEDEPVDIYTASESDSTTDSSHELLELE